VKVMKGRSSRKVQQEFPELRKRYWRRHFWGRGYFSVTRGNVTDEMIEEYIKIMLMPTRRIMLRTSL